MCVWQRDWVRGLDPRAPTFISLRFVQDKPFKKFQLLSIDQSRQFSKQLKTNILKFVNLLPNLEICNNQKGKCSKNSFKKEVGNVFGNSRQKTNF